MNRYNNKLNLFSNKRIVSKGGPLPHYDPPNPKFLKKNRIHTFGDQLLYITNDATKEYICNRKHMYAKNLLSAVKIYIKVIIGGLVLPTMFILYLRHVSQDLDNYYVKQYSPIVGEMSYKNNIKERSQFLKSILATNNDFLGRRGTNFYKVNGNFEENLEKSFFDNTIKILSEVNGKKAV